MLRFRGRGPCGGTPGLGPGLFHLWRAKRGREVPHPVKGQPGGNPPVECSRGRAGQRFAQPLSNQRFCGFARHIRFRCVIQIAGVIENEGKHSGLRIRPVQRRCEPHGFPRGDIKQIPFIYSQRVYWCAADVEIRQRFLIRVREGRVGGKVWAGSYMYPFCANLGQISNTMIRDTYQM